MPFTVRFGVECEQRFLAAGQWLTIGRSWNRANTESCACTLQGSELPRRTLHLRVRDGPDRRVEIAMPREPPPDLHSVKGQLEVTPDAYSASASFLIAASVAGMPFWASSSRFAICA